MSPNQMRIFHYSIAVACLLVIVVTLYREYIIREGNAGIITSSRSVENRYGLQERRKAVKPATSQSSPDIPPGILLAIKNKTSLTKTWQVDVVNSKPIEISPFSNGDGGLIFNRLLGEKKSPFAYVTLIHGIDNSYRYRGFLYSALIMRKALQSLQSKADFICMIGYSTTGDALDYKSFVEDISLLEKAGIRLIYLPRLLPDKPKVNFAEMALLKILPWSFVDYDRIQYFDGDILPLKNMDCFFKLGVNTFNTGNASPLNSGWFLAVPNMTLFERMREKAIQRLTNPWNETSGWGKEMPSGIFFRGTQKEVTKWSFNGASLDQGLLFHTYVLNEGNVLMLDASAARRYGPRFTSTTLNVRKEVRCCNNRLPTESFAHFTGQKKPWLQNLKKTRDSALILWRDSLDSLQLPINSSNAAELASMRPPLGYFHPNK
jgi:hypothetical protein